MLPDDKRHHLIDILSALPKHLSPILKHKEHLLQLARQIAYFDQAGVDPRPPFYGEECTPSLKDIVAPFVSAFRVGKTNTVDGRKNFQAIFQRTPINELLLIMGQRQTSASISDVGGVPPLREDLWGAFDTRHKHTLSVGARAWCKHANRSGDNFWGEVSGNDDHKNRFAQEILRKLFAHYTWWNVFEHYKHRVVYEIRVSSGHGARWTADGKVFIGFLEPFIEA